MSDHDTPRVADSFSRAEIEAFVADWYRKLDIHAPAEELISMVADQVEMQFPEGTVRGVEEFRAWYEGVIRLFFDELHTVTRVGIVWRDDRYPVSYTHLDVYKRQPRRRGTPA